MHINLTTPAAIPIALACGVSAAASVAYFTAWAPSTGYAIGIGAGAIALDLCKPMLFFKTAEAYKASSGFWRTLFKVGSWGCFALILALASKMAIDGAIIKLRSDFAASRAGDRGGYDRADAAYKKAEAEIEKIGTVEAVDALEAQIEAVKPTQFWKATEQCTKVKGPQSQEACRPVTDLRAKIAASKRAGELRAEMAGNRKVLDTTKRPSHDDAQAANYAAVFNVSQDFVVLVITWIVGGGIELLSCFGLFLLPAPKGPPPEVEKPPVPEVSKEQRAKAWLQGMLAAQDNGRLSVLNLNGTLATKFGVDPATCTRWRKKWEKQGHWREKTQGRQIILIAVRRRAVA